MPAGESPGPDGPVLRYNPGMRYLLNPGGRDGRMRVVELAALALVGAAAAAVPAASPAADGGATTRPASATVAAAPARDEAKILLLPFQLVGGHAGDSWIGRSIQQSLMTDLITNGPVQAATS